MANFFEEEFVLGDLKVFKEFDSSHFISNAKFALTNKVHSVKMDWKFNYYTNMLEKAIYNFNIINIEPFRVVEFIDKYDRLSKIDESEIRMKEIRSIEKITFKPQYLIQYANFVGDAINNVLNDTADENYDASIKILSNEAVDRVKRQVVRINGTTSSPEYSVSNKELQKLESGRYIYVSSNYIKGEIVPFVKNINSIKEKTVTEANSVLNAVKEIEVTMKAMVTSLNTIKASEDLPVNKVNELNKISYNSIRGILEVTSFLTFMVIRKLNLVSDNINACSNLLIDVENLYADTKFEATYTDDALFPTDTHSLAEGLINGSADAYTRLAENILEFHKNIPNVDFIDTPEAININFTDDQDFNSTVYNNIIKMYKEISDGLDIISSKSDDYLLVLDDVINEAGFQLRLEDRFRRVLNDITDVTEYVSANRAMINGQVNEIIFKRGLAEVTLHPKMMEEIANLISDVYVKAQGLQKRFNENINDQYKNTESINELNIFMERFMEEYKVLTNVVAARSMMRLRKIGSILNEISSKDEYADLPTVEPVNTDSVLDFTEGALGIDEYEEEVENYFESLQLAYHKEKAYVLEGVKLIYEEEQGTTNGNSGDTTPTVSDGSGVNSNASNGSSNVSTKGSVEWIASTTQRFRDWVQKHGSKNKEWAATNRDNISNREYSNVSINILPYDNMSMDKIKTDADTLVNNLNNIELTDNDKKSDIYGKLFSFVSGGIDVTKDLKSQLENYNKTGSTQEPKTIAVSNGDLKQKMPEYIEYIVTFYDNAADEIATKMTSVGDALTNAINKINPNNQAEVQQVQQEIQSNPEGTPVDSNSTNTQQTTTPATTPEQSNAVATGAPAAQPVAASGNDYVDGYAYLESFIDLFMEDDTQTTTTPSSTGNTDNSGEDPNKQLSKKDAAKVMIAAVKVYIGTVFNALKSQVNDKNKVAASLAPKNPVTPAKEVDNVQPEPTNNTPEQQQQPTVDNPQGGVPGVDPNMNTDNNGNQVNAQGQVVV